MLLTGWIWMNSSKNFSIRLWHFRQLGKSASTLPRSLLYRAHEVYNNIQVPTI